MPLLFLNNSGVALFDAVTTSPGLCVSSGATSFSHLSSMIDGRLFRELSHFYPPARIHSYVAPMRDK